MVKRSVRAVFLLVSLVTCVASANAQSTHRVKVDVPFQFVLDDQLLPAGIYTIERTNAARPSIITLKKVGGTIVRLVQTQRVEKENPSTASSLIFIRRDGKHYLFQVWNVGAMNGSEIPSVHKNGRQQRKDLTLVTLRAKAP